MLSVFRKKLVTSGVRNDRGQSSESSNFLATSNVSVLDPQLQKKFARGIQYNLKILIKGDRNVGKSCLFNRLQGKPFLDEYVPTEEIRAASVQWNYRATDDVIKVDVWDVVDKSRTRRKKMDGLKMNNHIHEFEEAQLDANFIDVYKNAHGVLLMFDVTKAWTWEYVQREISSIPNNLPVLILANRLDMSHHRQVRREQASFFVECLDRGQNASKRQTLLKQLETNTKEIELSYEEMDFFAESDENNYEKFMDTLNRRRRQDAENVAPKSTSDVIVGNANAGTALIKNNSIQKQKPNDFSVNVNSAPSQSKLPPIGSLPNSPLTTKSTKQSVEKPTSNRMRIKNNSKINHVDEFVPDEDEVEAASFFDPTFDAPAKGYQRPTDLKLVSNEYEDSDEENNASNDAVVLNYDKGAYLSEDELESYSIPELQKRNQENRSISALETPMAYHVPILPGAPPVDPPPVPPSPSPPQSEPSVSTPRATRSPLMMSSHQKSDLSLMTPLSANRKPETMTSSDRKSDPSSVTSLSSNRDPVMMTSSSIGKSMTSSSVNGKLASMTSSFLDKSMTSSSADRNSATMTSPLFDKAKTSLINKSVTSLSFSQAFDPSPKLDDDNDEEEEAGPNPLVVTSTPIDDWSDPDQSENRANASYFSEKPVVINPKPSNVIRKKTTKSGDKSIEKKPEKSDKSRKSGTKSRSSKTSQEFFGQNLHPDKRATELNEFYEEI